MTRIGRTSGFTLLEVMVAIAILALALSAIFSSEAGAIKIATRSRKMGVATLLARCKMGEIEEQIAKDGLPAVFASGSDKCCEGSAIDGYTCDWEIDPIVLPDDMFPTGDEKGVPGKAGSDMPSKAGPSEPAKDPLSALADVDATDALSGGDVGGFASMAMSYAYPVLKPAFEGQIRRATVTVRWQEGSAKHDFDVTQYVVADQPVIPALPDGTQQAPGAQPGGLPGMPETPGLGI